MPRVTHVKKAQKDQGTCDFCGKPIPVGSAYKWIAPKTSKYSSRRMVRHAGHPSWHPWEYTQALWAMVAQIQYEAEQAINSAESADDVQSALDDAVSAANELAEEKRANAQTVEDGFGHPTSTSEELNERADALEEWASQMESVSVPDYPEAEGECEPCSGTGKVAEEECEACGGDGQAKVTDDMIDEWRSEIDGDVLQVVQDSGI